MQGTICQLTLHPEDVASNNHCDFVRKRCRALLSANGASAGKTIDSFTRSPDVLFSTAPYISRDDRSSNIQQIIQDESFNEDKLFISAERKRISNLFSIPDNSTFTNYKSNHTRSNLTRNINEDVRWNSSFNQNVKRDNIAFKSQALTAGHHISTVNINSKTISISSRESDNPEEEGVPPRSTVFHADASVANSRRPDYVSSSTGRRDVIISSKNGKAQLQNAVTQRSDSVVKNSRKRKLKNKKRKRIIGQNKHRDENDSVVRTFASVVPTIMSVNDSNQKIVDDNVSEYLTTVDQIETMPTTTNIPSTQTLSVSQQTEAMMSATASSTGSDSLSLAAIDNQTVGNTVNSVTTVSNHHNNTSTTILTTLDIIENGTTVVVTETIRK